MADTAAMYAEIQRRRRAAFEAEHGGDGSCYCTALACRYCHNWRAATRELARGFARLAAEPARVSGGR